MGKDLAAAFPDARQAFDEADSALGFPLSKLCFDGPAVWAVTKKALSGKVRAAAGHSLGEHTAYHAAGAIGLTAAVKLVRRRGELMNETGIARPGTMAAILGTPSRPIAEICEEASREAGLVVPANYNSDEQTVISGEVGGVEKAMELAKAAGAKRAVRLPVSGAFHSPLMEPAAAG